MAAETITNSPINIFNRDPEEIKRLAGQLDRSKGDRRAAESKAADLARQLDKSNITTQTVMGFLRVLARQPDLNLDQVPTKLAEITTNYLTMQDRLANPSAQDPAAADLARQANEAGQAGRFQEADRLLEQAEARETTAIDEHRRKAGELRAARGDNAATQLHYADAARHYEAAGEELPQSVSGEKANYLSQAGDKWIVVGNLANASNDYHAALGIRKRLASEEPGNVGWQYALSISHKKVGEVQKAQGHLVGALGSYRTSLAIREALAKADPSSPSRQGDLWVLHGEIGEVQKAQGDLTAALASYQEALESFNRLAKEDANNGVWLLDAATCHLSIGDVEQAQGDLPAALASYQASLATRESLAKADPGNADWQRSRAISCRYPNAAG